MAAGKITFPGCKEAGHLFSRIAVIFPPEARVLEVQGKKAKIATYSVYTPKVIGVAPAFPKINPATIRRRLATKIILLSFLIYTHFQQSDGRSKADFSRVSNRASGATIREQKCARTGKSCLLSYLRARSGEVAVCRAAAGAGAVARSAEQVADSINGMLGF